MDLKTREIKCKSSQKEDTRGEALAVALKNPLSDEALAVASLRFGTSF